MTTMAMMAMLCMTIAISIIVIIIAGICLAIIIAMQSWPKQHPRYSESGQ